MRSFYRVGWVRAAGIAVLAACAADAAVAADPPSVIVIFDGSGSMWGNLEGAKQSKLVMARDGLRRALGKLDPETRVGLAGFGHRRGDCGDVEVLVPPERLDVERIMAPLGPYNPKGRGPLTQALREAAKVLGERPRKRSIVLIHDDADNCQQDVCAAAAELQSAGIIAHVVGLGLKPADASKMVCLPQTTAGRLFNTQNGEQIAAALEEVLKLASGEGGGSPVSRPAPAASAPAATEAAAPVPADAPPGLYLRALLVPKGDPVGRMLHWRVSLEDQSGTVVFDERATNPVVPVAAGRYVVEVREGALATRQAVEVADKGPTVVPLVLNAGVVQVRALAQKSGAPLGDAVIVVRDVGQLDSKKANASGVPVAIFKGAEGTVMLPAGSYLARAEQGVVRGERTVTVAAGSQTQLDIALNGARVSLATASRDGGGPLDAPVYSVVEEDPDAPKGRREVARSAARQAEFVLPPGTYYVIARQDSVEARERLAVGPGDVVKRTLSYSAGRLALSTKLAGGAQPGAEPVSYRVERLDGPAPEVLSTSRTSPVLLLPAGRYRVEGRYGAMNARTTREIEVKPGQTQQLVLEPQAATLRLRLAGSGTLASDVLWDLRDEAGRTVWATGQSEPVATLQPGRYVVRAETRDKRYDKTVELRAGETRLLEVTAD